MATVNFSVPEDVKQAFNEAFKGQNKSAIIADLMREAVERAQQRQRQSEAIDRILALRAQTEPVSAEAIRAAREEGRP
jgi:metal-responsive CopG/Arc/MetJ family transcriptional regulator